MRQLIANIVISSSLNNTSSRCEGTEMDLVMVSRTTWQLGNSQLKKKKKKICYFIQNYTIQITLLGWKVRH